MIIFVPLTFLYDLSMITREEPFNHSHHLPEFVSSNLPPIKL